MLSVQKDLEEMRVEELKEELEARGEPRNGPNPMLQRRLHAAIVRRILEDRDSSEEDFSNQGVDSLGRKSLVV